MYCVGIVSGVGCRVQDVAMVVSGLVCGCAVVVVMLFVVAVKFEHFLWLLCLLLFLLPMDMSAYHPP